MIRSSGLKAQKYTNKTFQFRTPGIIQTPSPMFGLVQILQIPRPGVSRMSFMDGTKRIVPNVLNEVPTTIIFFEIPDFSDTLPQLAKYL